MTPLDLDRAATEFVAARTGARLVGPLPADATPATLDDAYRIQAETARRLGGYRGWKVGALTAEQQAKAGVAAPTAARLIAAFVHDSPARLSIARLRTPKLEAELAFSLARDLPPRAAPYSEEEVADAVAAMHPAIEVADTRLAPQPSLAMNLADAMANGAFIVGPAYGSWRAMDRGAVAVSLRVNGTLAATGQGAVVLGDPLRAVVVFANNPIPGGPGLRRGDIVTTGSLTGVTPVAAGDVAVAEFAAIGTVEVSFTP
ncbi:MAG: fumarylacetoacetate hydrolase family protein [Alphaproteobacteria bacterium]|nr:fumarylacetoacetate hydrolase family protein [Alphaproteobacteria bacterium]